MTEVKLYAVWAAIGPLVGVIIGSWLAARWQRRQWIQDNKKAEYRQVLDALQTYRWRLLNHLAISAGAIMAVDPRVHEEERRALAEAEVSLSNSLADRLFIRNAVAKSRVGEDLNKFLRTVTRNDENSISQSIEALSDFHERIVQAAERDLKLE